MSRGVFSWIRRSIVWPNFHFHRQTMLFALLQSACLIDRLQMFMTAVLGNYAIFKRSTHTLFLLSAKTAWPNMIAKHNLQTQVQTRLLPVKILIVSSDWKWKFVSVITVYNIREFIVMDWSLEWHVRIMDEAPNYVTLYKPRLPINLNVSLNCHHTLQPKRNALTNWAI